jgi:hypothetical protein
MAVARLSKSTKGKPGAKSVLLIFHSLPAFRSTYRTVSTLECVCVRESLLRYWERALARNSAYGTQATFVAGNVFFEVTSRTAEDG